MRSNVFRNDRVHVMKRMCATCIFRPGNLMGLKPGRVEQMVADATRMEAHITCHKTTYGESAQGEAVCRGFFEQHATAPFQIADRMGYIVFQEEE